MMYSKRQGKLGTALLLTTATVMAAMMAVPEAAYGAAQRMREHHAQQEKARQALEQSKKAEEVKFKAEEHKSKSLDTYSKALKDPAHALDGAHPLGIELHKIKAHAVTHSHKIDLLEGIEAGGDAVHKENVAKALGLNPADAGVRADVGHFITAAKKRLVKLPEKKAAIANLEKYKTALLDPVAILGALAAPGNLPQAIADAVADAHSAANGRPHGTPAEKVDCLKRIETHDVPAEQGHRSAIRNALGLDSTVGHFGATNPSVQRFIEMADHDIHITGLLTGMGGADNKEKTEQVLARLSTAHNRASDGVLIGAAAAPVTIDQALTRIGL